MKQLGIRDKILVLSALNFNYKQIQAFLSSKFNIHIELHRIARIVTNYEVEDLLAMRYLKGYSRIPNYIISYAKSNRIPIILPQPGIKKRRVNTKKKESKRLILKTIDSDNSVYNPNKKITEVSTSEFIRILKEESIRIGSRDANLVYQNVKFRLNNDD